MSGINYDLQQIKAIAFDIDGVLSSSQIPLHSSGEPMRVINIKDGYAIQLAVKHGYHIAIISGAKTEAIQKRFEGLGVTDIFLGATVKLQIFEDWITKYNLNHNEVAYIGDDIPDMEIMQIVGLPIAPADAAIDIKNIAKYISPCKGGEGCGRDIIEQVMKAQSTWLSDKRAFGW
ncbi:MAG: HAD-IIIA family hydrolase [Muribaculaceae bacterium]